MYAVVNWLYKVLIPLDLKAEIDGLETQLRFHPIPPYLPSSSPKEAKVEVGGFFAREFQRNSELNKIRGFLNLGMN